jgi:DNA polymerase III epsilon subunit-like protein
MRDEPWLIVDTETNGLLQPIYVVEIAAQRMRGWEADGEPFRVLLNHDVPIDPGAEAVHGYSREYLRLHGEDPVRAHAAFHAYAGELPIVAYNLAFDWGRVLAPEYQRLGVPVSGCRGFCALTLARRVIDDTCNHRLETLKRHFGLGDERSHRGLNDVVTTVRLFQQVFRARLEPAGITGFDAVARFSRRTPVARCIEELRAGWADEAPAAESD